MNRGRNVCPHGQLYVNALYSLNELLQGILDTSEMFRGEGNSESEDEQRRGTKEGRYQVFD